MDQVTTIAIERPLWRRIVDFPLVAIVIGTVLLVIVRLIGIFLLGAYLGLRGQKPSKEQFAALLTGPYQVPVSLVAILGSFLVYWLVIRRMGRTRRDDLAWNGSHSAVQLGQGVLTGFLIMALAVALAAVAGVYRVTGPGDSTQLLKELVGTAILAGVWEEMLFRGVLFRWMEELAGSWIALLSTSALFGAMHLGNPNASGFAAFCIAVEAGLLLGAAYMLTRSLWLPIGLHAAWNFTQGEIFDVNVSGLDEHGLVTAQMSGPPLLSGNGFGLEASIFGLAVATLTGLCFLWLAVKNGEVVGPMWSRARGYTKL